MSGNGEPSGLYPAAIDDIPTGAPGQALGEEHLSAHNRLRGAIERTQRTVGINPSRTLTEVAATLGSLPVDIDTQLENVLSRLNGIDSAIASINSVISGLNVARLLGVSAGPGVGSGQWRMQAGSTVHMIGPQGLGHITWPVRFANSFLAVIATNGDHNAVGGGTVSIANADVAGCEIWPWRRGADVGFAQTYYQPVINQTIRVNWVVFGW